MQFRVPVATYRCLVAPQNAKAISGRARPTGAANGRAHPLAAAVWRVLRDRSEADRRLVFDACQRHLENAGTTAQQAQALAALRRFVALRGHAPSRRDWDAFRAAQLNPRAWPSAHFIRQALGGWTGARAALGEPVPDILARRLTAQGTAFEQSELLAAVKWWAGSAPRPLRQKEFHAWCSEQLSRVVLDEDTRPRLPLSPETIRRHFGGWRAFMAAADLLDGLARDDQDSSAASAVGWDLDSAPSTTRPRYSKEELLAWLDWFGEHVGVVDASSLSQDAYDRLQRRVASEAAREGRILHVPVSRTYAQRFGSWPEAKVAAGWMRPEQAILQPSRARYEPDGLVAALTAAIEACGLPLSVVEYRRWRQRRLRDLAQGDARARVPSHTLLRARLGSSSESWEAAVAYVYSASGDTEAAA